MKSGCAVLTLFLALGARAADLPPGPLRSYLPLAAKAEGAALGPLAVRYLHMDGLLLKILKGYRATEALDGKSHDLYVGLSNGAAVCFVLAAHQTAEGTIKGSYFKTDLDGRLTHAAGMTGEADETGAPVKGSGRISQLDETDEDVVGRFRHELAFWTKGRFRKPAAAPAQAGSKGA